MEKLWQDFRFALRMLMKNLGFATTSIFLKRLRPGSRVQFWSGSRSGGRACGSRSRTSDGPPAGVPSSK